MVNQSHEDGDAQMRPAGTDAVGALRWGLGRYRVLFLACLVLGAVLVPFAALARATPVDAQALVIAQRLDMDLAALPRYGEAVFDNGQVAQAIEAKFGDLGDYQDIIPDRVSLVDQQDSIVFAVVGHDVNPKTAADIANLGADTFVQALNAAGVGVGAFALQSPAVPPAAPKNTLGTLFAVPVGIAAGLVLGLAAVSVLLVARRPVIDGADAEEATGVRSLGTVSVPRTRRGQFAQPADFSGLVPVCRRLLALSTPTVVLVSRPRQERVRQQLAVALASLLRRVRAVHFISPSELQAMAADREGGGYANSGNGRHTDDRASLTLVDSSEPLDLVQPPELTATLLVVPEGIGSAALRAAVVEHLGGSAEARLLLVKRGRRVRVGTVSSVDATVSAPTAETVGVTENA
jgi:capsular polysaccharide biosynthesis protein